MCVRHTVFARSMLTEHSHCLEPCEAERFDLPSATPYRLVVRSVANAYVSTLRATHRSHPKLHDSHAVRGPHADGQRLAAVAAHGCKCTLNSEGPER